MEGFAGCEYNGQQRETRECCVALAYAYSSGRFGRGLSMLLSLAKGERGQTWLRAGQPPSWQLTRRAGSRERAQMLSVPRHQLSAPLFLPSTVPRDLGYLFRMRGFGMLS
jgi:hypothetical protein